MMKNRFEGRVAVITGGARGLGIAIGSRIAREGGRVHLLDLEQKDLDLAVANMEGQGTGHVLNITDEPGLRDVLKSIYASEGRLDIMVNSAGIVGQSAENITQYDTKTFESVLHVNLTGSFLATKYAIPHMLKNNYGRVLLIASIAGKEGNPNMVGYAASKAGVIGLVKAVGKEFAETGVTINGMAPAVIRTPMNENTAPEQLRAMTAKIPMNRLGTIGEFASMASWIVSDEASFNTGVIFDLSGGRATY